MSYIPPTTAGIRRNRKRGVIGVMFRENRLLIIRRSLSVKAPGKLCLPGGGIEAGESEQEALVREMQEEISVAVEPLRLCHRSVTPCGTQLAWWLAHLDETAQPIANPEEVAEIHWMSPADIDAASNVLPSLPEFLSQWRCGRIQLPWNPVQ